MPFCSSCIILRFYILASFRFPTEIKSYIMTIDQENKNKQLLLLKNSDFLLALLIAPANQQARTLNESNCLFLFTWGHLMQI
jgi:hypothetical protein